MKGWTPDGREIELTGDQEALVRKVLDWARNKRRGVVLPFLGRGTGKSVILATVARYDAEPDGTPGG